MRILRIACVLLAATLLASCGIFEKTPQATVAPDTTASFQPEALDSTTIKLLMPPYNNDMQDLLDKRAAQINVLLAQRGIPAQLEMESVRGYDTLDRLLGGDIAIVAPAFEDGMYEELALDGKLADLTGELESRPELYALDPEHMWEMARVNGAIYGFPLNNVSSGSTTAAQSGMLIRSDVLSALNAQMPETLDELINLGKMASEQGLDSKIAYLNSYPPYPLHRTYDEWPFYVDDPSLFIYYIDGTVAPYPGSDVYWKDVEAFDRLSNEGLLVVYDNIGMASSRMSLSKWNSLASFYIGARPSEGAPHYDDFTLAQLSPESVYYRVYAGFYQLLVVSADSPNAALALEVIEAIYSDQEVYDAFFYGEEGVDWEIQADGGYRPINDTPWAFAFRHAGRMRQNVDAKPAPWYQEVPTELMVDMPAVRFMVSDSELLSAVTRCEAYINYNNYVKLRAHKEKKETIEKAVNLMLDDPSYQQLFELVQTEYAGFVKKAK